MGWNMNLNCQIQQFSHPNLWPSLHFGRGQLYALEPVPSAAVPAAVETTTAAVATAAVAAAVNPENCEYKLEYRSSTNAVAIRKVVKVEGGPPKKRQVVEIIGRDRLTRDAVTSIATQARGRLLAGESEAHVVQWAKEQSKQ